MTRALPEGSIINVAFQLRLPAAATLADVQDWLEINIGGGSIRTENPLRAFDLETFGPAGVKVDPTGLTGRIEQFDHRIGEDGRAYFRERFVTERVTE